MSEHEVNADDILDNVADEVFQAEEPVEEKPAEVAATTAPTQESSPKDDDDDVIDLPVQPSAVTRHEAPQKDINDMFAGMRNMQDKCCYKGMFQKQAIVTLGVTGPDAESLTLTDGEVVIAGEGVFCHNLLSGEVNNEDLYNNGISPLVKNMLTGQGCTVIYMGRSEEAEFSDRLLSSEIPVYQSSEGRGTVCRIVADLQQAIASDESMASKFVMKLAFTGLYQNTDNFTFRYVDLMQKVADDDGDREGSILGGKYLPPLDPSKSGDEIFTAINKLLDSPSKTQFLRDKKISLVVVLTLTNTETSTNYTSTFVDVHSLHCSMFDSLLRNWLSDRDTGDLGVLFTGKNISFNALVSTSVSELSKITTELCNKICSQAKSISETGTTLKKKTFKEAGREVGKDNRVTEAAGIAYTQFSGKSASTGSPLSATTSHYELARLQRENNIRIGEVMKLKDEKEIQQKEIGELLAKQRQSELNIRKREVTIDKLGSDIIKLTTELNDYRHYESLMKMEGLDINTISESLKESAKAKTDLQNLQSAIGIDLDKLPEIIKEKDQQLAAMSNLLEEATASDSNLEQDLLNKKSELDNALQKLHALEQGETSGTQQADDELSAFRIIQNELSSKGYDFSKISEALDEKNELLDSATRDLETSLEDMESLIQELETLKQEKDDLSAQIDNSMDQQQSSDFDLQKLQKEIENLRNENEQLNSDLENVRPEVAGMRRDNEEMREETDRVNEELAKLAGRHSGLQDDNATLNSNWEKLVSQEEALRLDFNELQNDYYTSSEALKTTEETLKELQASRNQENNESREEAASNAKVIDALKQQLSDLQASHEADSRKLSRNATEAAKKLQEAEQDRSRALEKAQQLTDQFNTAAENAESVEEELRNKIRKADKTISELRSGGQHETAMLQKELDDLQKQLEDLQNRTKHDTEEWARSSQRKEDDFSRSLEVERTAAARAREEAAAALEQLKGEQQRELKKQKNDIEREHERAQQQALANAKKTADEELAKLRKELIDSSNKLADGERIHQRRERELQQLQTEKEDANRRLKQLQSDLTAAKELLDNNNRKHNETEASLKRDITNKDQELKNVIRTSERLNDQLKSTDNKLQDLKQQQSDSIRESETARKKASEREANALDEVQKNTKQLQATRDEIQSLRSQLTALQGKCSVLESSNKDGRDEIAALNNKINNLNKQREADGKRISDQKNEINELERIASTIRGELQQQKTTSDKLADKVSQKDVDLRELESNLQQETSKLNKLRNDGLKSLTNHKNDIAKLEKQIAILEEKAHSADVKFSDANDLNASLEKQLQQRDSDLSKSRKDLIAEKQKNDELQSTTNRLRAELDQSATQRNSNNNEISKQQSDLKESKAQLADTIAKHNRELKSLQEELNALKKDNDRLRTTIESLNGELSEARSENNSLTAKLSEANRNGTALEEKLTKAEKKIKNTETNLSEMAAKLRGCQDDLSNAEQQNTNLKESIKKSDKESDAMKTEIQKLQTETARLANDLKSEKQNHAAALKGATDRSTIAEANTEEMTRLAQAEREAIESELKNIKSELQRERSSSKDKDRSRQNELTAANAELERLSQTINSTRKDLNQSKQHIHDLEDKIRDSERQLQTSISTNQIKDTELQSARDLLTKADNINASLQNDNDLLASDMEDVVTINKELKSQLSDLNNKLHNQVIEVDDLKGKLRTASQREDRLNLASNGKQQLHDNEIQSLKKELEILSDDMNILSNVNNDLQRGNRSLERNLLNTESERNDLSKSLTASQQELESERNRLNNNIESLQKTVAQLEEQLSGEVSNGRTLKGSLEKEKVAKEQLDAVHNQLLKQQDMQKDLISNLQSQLDETLNGYSREQEQQNDVITELQSALSAAKHQQARNASEMVETQKESSALNDAMSSFQTKLSDVQEQNSKLNNTIDAKDREISRLSHKLQSAQQQFDRELSDLQEDMSHMQRRHNERTPSPASEIPSGLVADLEKRLREAEDKIADADKKYRSTERLREDLEKELSETTSKMTSLTGNMNIIQDQLDHGVISTSNLLALHQRSSSLPSNINSIARRIQDQEDEILKLKTATQATTQQLSSTDAALDSAEVEIARREREVLALQKRLAEEQQSWEMIRNNLTDRLLETDNEINNDRERHEKEMSDFANRIHANDLHFKSENHNLRRDLTDAQTELQKQQKSNTKNQIVISDLQDQLSNSQQRNTQNTADYNNDVQSIKNQHSQETDKLNKIIADHMEREKTHIRDKNKSQEDVSKTLNELETLESDLEKYKATLRTLEERLREQEDEIKVITLSGERDASELSKVNKNCENLKKSENNLRNQVSTMKMSMAELQSKHGIGATAMKDIFVLLQFVVNEQHNCIRVLSLSETDSSSSQLDDISRIGGIIRNQFPIIISSIDNLQRDANHLKNSLKDSQSETETLRNQLLRLTSESSQAEDDLRSRLQNQQLSADEIARELKRLSDKVANLSETCTEIQDDKYRLEMEKSTLEGKNRALEKTSSSLGNEINALHEEARALRNRLSEKRLNEQLSFEDLEREISNLNGELDKSNHKLLQSHEVIDNLKIDNETLKTTMKSLTKSNQNLEEDLSRATSTIQNRDKLISDQTTDGEGLHKEIEFLKIDLTRAIQDVDEAMLKISKHDSEMQDVNRQLEQAVKNSFDSELAADDIKRQLENGMRTTAQQSAKCSRQEQTITMLDNRVKDLEQLSSERLQLAHNSQEMVSENERLSFKISSLQSDIQKLRDDCREADREKWDLQGRLKTCEHDNTDLIIRTEKLEHRVASNDDELKRAGSQQERLQKADAERAEALRRSDASLRQATEAKERQRMADHERAEVAEALASQELLTADIQRKNDVLKHKIRGLELTISETQKSNTDLNIQAANSQDELTATSATFNNTIALLRQELQESRDQCAEAKKKNAVNEMQQKIYDLEQREEEQSEVIAKLTSELQTVSKAAASADDLRKRMVEISNRVADSEDDITIAEEARRLMEQELADVKDSRSQIGFTNQKLVHQLETSASQIATLRQTISQLEQQHHELQLQGTTFNMTLVESKRKKSLTEHELTTCKQEMADIIKLNKALEEGQDDLHQEHTKLKISNEQYVAELQDLRTKVSEIANLRQQLAESGRRVSVLDEEILELISQSQRSELSLQESQRNAKGFEDKFRKLSDLPMKLSAADDRIQILIDQNTALENEIHILKDSNQVNSFKVTDLIHQSEQLTKRLHTTEETCKQNQERYNTAHEDVLSTQQKLQERDQRVSTLEIKIISKENQISDSERKIDSLAAEVGDLEQDKRSLSSQLVIVEEKNKDFQNNEIELSTLRQQIADVQRKLMQHEKTSAEQACTISRLESRLHTTESELCDAHESSLTVPDLHIRLNEYHRETEQLQAHVSAVDQARQHAESETLNLKEICSNLEQQLHSATESNATLNDKSITQEKVANNWKSEFERENAMRSTIEEDITELRDSHMLLKSELAVSVERNEQLSSEIIDSQDHFLRCETELSSSRTAVNDLTLKIQYQSEVIQDLTATKTQQESVIKSHSDLTNKLTIAEDTIASGKKEIDRLHLEIHAANRAVENISVLEKELTFASSKLAEHEARLTHDEGNKRRSETEKADMKEELGSSITRNNQLEATVSELENLLQKSTHQGMAVASDMQQEIAELADKLKNESSLLEQARHTITQQITEIESGTNEVVLLRSELDVRPTAAAVVEIENNFRIINKQLRSKEDSVILWEAEARSLVTELNQVESSLFSITEKSKPETLPTLEGLSKLVTSINAQLPQSFVSTIGLLREASYADLNNSVSIELAVERLSSLHKRVSRGDSVSDVAVAAIAYSLRWSTFLREKLSDNQTLVKLLESSVTSLQRGNNSKALTGLVEAADISERNHLSTTIVDCLKGASNQCDEMRVDHGLLSAVISGIEGDGFEIMSYFMDLERDSIHPETGTLAVEHAECLRAVDPGSKTALNCVLDSISTSTDGWLNVSREIKPVLDRAATHAREASSRTALRTAMQRIVRSSYLHPVFNEFDKKLKTQTPSVTLSQECLEILCECSDGEVPSGIVELATSIGHRLSSITDNGCSEMSRSNLVEANTVLLMAVITSPHAPHNIIRTLRMMVNGSTPVTVPVVEQLREDTRSAAAQLYDIPALQTVLRKTGERLGSVQKYLLSTTPPTHVMWQVLATASALAAALSVDNAPAGQTLLNNLRDAEQMRTVPRSTLMELQPEKEDVPEKFFTFIEYLKARASSGHLVESWEISNAKELLHAGMEGLDDVEQSGSRPTTALPLRTAVQQQQLLDCIIDVQMKIAETTNSANTINDLSHTVIEYKAQIQALESELESKSVLDVASMWSVLSPFIGGMPCQLITVGEQLSHLTQAIRSRLESLVDFEFSIKKMVGEYSDVVSQNFSSNQGGREVVLLLGSILDQLLADVETARSTITEQNELLKQTRLTVAASTSNMRTLNRSISPSKERSLGARSVTPTLPRQFIRRH